MPFDLPRMTYPGIVMGAHLITPDCRHGVTKLASVGHFLTILFFCCAWRCKSLPTDCSEVGHRREFFVVECVNTLSSLRSQLISPIIVQVKDAKSCDYDRRYPL